MIRVAPAHMRGGLNEKITVQI